MPSRYKNARITVTRDNGGGGNKYGLAPRIGVASHIHSAYTMVRTTGYVKK